MRKLSLILSILLCASIAFAGAQKVKLPFSNDLEDQQDGITAGTGRLDKDTSDSFVNASGVLDYSGATRSQLITDTAPDSTTTYWSKSKGNFDDADSVSFTHLSENITLYKYEEDNQSGLHRLERANTTTGSGTYILTGYAKSSDRTKARLEAYGFTSSSNPYAVYNLSDGTVFSSGGGANTDIESIGGGVYRLVLRFTIASSEQIGTYFALVNDAGSHSYQGVSGEGAYIGGINFYALPSGNVIGSDLFDQETLGSELITNGTFGSDITGWAGINGGSAAWSAGTLELTINGSGDGFEDTGGFAVTAGKIYKISFDFTAGTYSGNFLIIDGLGIELLANGSLPNYEFATSETSISCYGIATGSNYTFRIQRGTAVTGTGYFDNISVQEVTAPAKGLPDDSQDGNGSAWPALAGSELVTNGDFASDTAWTKGTGWTISGGTASCDGTQSAASSLTHTTPPLAVSTWYHVEYTISNYSAGAVREIVGGAHTLGWESANGTYTGYLYNASGSNTSFQFQADADFVGDIDDVSVREVQLSWTPYGTNTIEIDEAVDAVKVTYGDNDSGASLVLQNATDLSSNLSAGEWYQLQLEAKCNNAGDNIAIRINDSGQELSRTGSLTTSFVEYTLNIKAISVGAFIRTINMAATDIVWIRNLTIKQIPPAALLEPGPYTNDTSVYAYPLPITANGIQSHGEYVQLLDYSEDFSEWTSTGITTNSSSIASPDGESNGYQFTPYADNVVLQFSTSNPAASTDYMFSVWIKSSDITSIKLGGYDGTSWFTSSAITISDEWARITNEFTTSASPAQLFVQIGAGGTWDTNQTIEVFGANLTESSYLLPYMETDGCPRQVASTAGAATGNGYRLTMSAALKDLFVSSGGAPDTDSKAQGTLIAKFTPNFNSTLDVSGGIVAISNAQLSLLHTDAGLGSGRIASRDGTNFPNNSIAYIAGTQYLVVVRWDSEVSAPTTGALVVWVSDDNGATWNKGTASNFDGDFPIGDYLWIGYGNEYPFEVEELYIYEGYYTDSQVENTFWQGNSNPVLLLFF